MKYPRFLGTKIKERFDFLQKSDFVKICKMQRTRKVLNPSPTQSVSDQDVFEAVCLDVADHIRADLISIWFCSFDGTGIQCQRRYDKITGRFSDGQALMKENYPNYFENIVEYNYISAPEARTNPATRELTEDYLEPNGILSLLDFILHENFKPIGVICCENRSCIRDWSEADKSYLRSIASLISFRFQFS